MGRIFTAYLDDKGNTTLTLGLAGQGAINIPDYEPCGDFNLVISTSGVTYDTEVLLIQKGNTPLSTLQYHSRNTTPLVGYILRPQEIKFLNPDRGEIITADDENNFVCFPVFERDGRYPITLSLNILRDGKKITVTVRHPSL